MVGTSVNENEHYPYVTTKSACIYIDLSLKVVAWMCFAEGGVSIALGSWNTQRKHAHDMENMQLIKGLSWNLNQEPAVTKLVPTATLPFFLKMNTKSDSDCFYIYLISCIYKSSMLDIFRIELIF